MPWGVERYEERIEHSTSDAHPENTAMIGDRMDTDIVAGIDVGIDRRQPATHHYAKFGTFKYSHTIEGVRVEPGPQAPRRR